MLPAINEETTQILIGDFVLRVETNGLHSYLCSQLHCPNDDTSNVEATFDNVRINQ